MQQLIRPFTEHPSSVGESYLAHMLVAFGFGVQMITAGFACLLHGIFPFAFVKTGSRSIETLHSQMVLHRDRRCAPPIAGDAAQEH